MQFAVIAFDGTDEDALQRRLAVREQHLALNAEMAAAGQSLYGAALLDDEGKMIGSVMICEFPSRDDLDAWLAEEPYVKGNVWQKIDIYPCRVAPAYQKK